MILEQRSQGADKPGFPERIHRATKRTAPLVISLETFLRAASSAWTPILSEGNQSAGTLVFLLRPTFTILPDL